MKNLVFLGFLEQSFFTKSANKRVKKSVITDVKLTVSVNHWSSWTIQLLLYFNLWIYSLRMFPWILWLYHLRNICLLIAINRLIYFTRPLKLKCSCIIILNKYLYPFQQFCCNKHKASVIIVIIFKIFYFFFILVYEYFFICKLCQINFPTFFSTPQMFSFSSSTFNLRKTATTKYSIKSSPFCFPVLL